MASMKQLMSIVVMLAAVSGLYGSDWRGFRGLERGGCGDLTSDLSTWSPAQNVAWKTAIRGRGHSSPVVAGNVVYLTTAYENARSVPIVKMGTYAIPLLVLLCVISGLGLLMQSLATGEDGRSRVGQHMRVFLFASLLAGVIILSLFGRYLLNPDDDAARHLLLSIVLMFSCLLLSPLFVPLCSRQHLAAGAVACAFAVLVFLNLKYRGLVSDLGSSQSQILIVAALLPAVLGSVLFSVHLRSRRRQSQGVESRGNVAPKHFAGWCFALTGGLGVASALLLVFLLLYRGADYQMPDRYVWENRIRPEVPWWCIGLCLMLVLLAIPVWYWRLSRAGATREPLLRAVLLITASLLGSVFFLRSSALKKPTESVRAIVCINRSDGRILWTCAGLVGRNRPQSRTVTHASPTPVTDGNRIYGYFGEDGLMCVSSAGQLLWKSNEPMFRCTHGAGTSPVVKDNVLVVVSDVKESKDLRSSITAFDGASGGPLWRKERKSHKAYAAYNTPLVREWKGRQVVIVHGWYDVKGYELKTGEELWSYPLAHEGMHLVASPVANGERLYVTGAKRVVALDLSKLGTDADPLLWSRPIPGEKSSTPVVVEGLMFLVTEPGQAFCLDARTGEIAWQERLKGSYFSSVLASAGKVFFTNEAGQTVVVAVDKQFRQLAANVLNESIYASLAPMEGQLFVRTTGHLYCLQEPRRRGFP